MLLVALPRTPVLIKSYHSYKFLERERGLFTFTLLHNFYHFYLQLSTIGIFIMLSVLPLFTCLIHLWRVFGISLFSLQQPYSFAHVLSGIYNLIIENVVASLLCTFAHRILFAFECRGDDLHVKKLNFKLQIRINKFQLLTFVRKGMNPFYGWFFYAERIHAIRELMLLDK